MISVIVPVYNVEEYLERCLKSIINQTYKELEIILVDDGSTDGSVQICDSYAEKDGRIRVFHKENGGLSSARNVGIENSKGEYMSFIDSDDYISEEYYEVMLSTLEKHNADISICNFELLYEEKELPVVVHSESVYDGKEAIMNNFFNKNCGEFVIACNKLYKKDLFEGLRYPEGRIYEDEALTYKVFYRAQKVVFSTDVLYGYYQRTGSIMGSLFRKKNLVILEIIDEINAFYELNNEKILRKKAAFRSLKILKIYMTKVKKEKNRYQDHNEFQEIYLILKNKYDNLIKREGMYFLMPVLYLYGLYKGMRL